MKPDLNETASSEPAAEKRWKPVYLRTFVVKALIKEHDHRCSDEFLRALDSHVLALVVKACETPNGKKKTLDSAVAKAIGIIDESVPTPAPSEPA